MKIIGIHDGHNASATLIVNGQIKLVIQEERLKNEKNWQGFPQLSILKILEESNLKPTDIDLVSFTNNYMSTTVRNTSRRDVYANYLRRNKIINTHELKARLRNSNIISNVLEKRNKEKRIGQITSLGFNANQVQFYDHHTIHAASAYYGLGDYKNDILVLTNDGSGDGLCASISIGSNGKLDRIATVKKRNSVGSLYSVFTFLLGMNPLEHEYKIMGMAPYVKQSYARQVADDLHAFFEISSDGLTWEFKKGYSVFTAMREIQQYITLKRFDNLMGGLQLFLEEFLVSWVKAAIKKTKIRKIALAGGTFMNVKANQLIMELDEVESIFIFPSCGDESNSIGAAYYTMANKDDYKKIDPLEDIYFGVEFSNEQIKVSFDNYNFKNKYTFEAFENIEEKLVELLEDNHVVARFKGREEFGARSLGNRAILANPSKREVIQEINDMIKSRDFWMPFASSVLDEDLSKYVIDNDKTMPYYMIITYDTHKEAENILAGIHPYDKTVRPQMVTQKHNKDYWKLIDSFKRKTGIGGLLNTSLNLHGLPLVHKPEDAFYVMENSHLNYLAIGNYLLVKKD